MASIRRLPSGKFQLRWTDPRTGKAVSETLGSEPEAKRRRRKVEAEIELGEYVTKSKITVAQYVRDWEERQGTGPNPRHRASTYAVNVNAISNRIEGTPFGNTLLTKLRHTDCQDW